VSSGGRLAELAAGYGVAHVPIPGGRQPRASLGFLALPVLAILVEIGLIPDCSDDVEEAVACLADISTSCGRDVPVEVNLAKQLSTSLAHRVPVVYGGSGLGEVAAYRFKCDLNEYAKSPAFAHSVPEMNHNELEAYGALNEAIGNGLLVVILRDSDDHERVALRLDVMKRIIEESGSEVIEVHSQGISPVARMLTLVMLTQLAAIYVGLIKDFDPGPVPVIENFKRQLADQ
jgi:glucose/mannose-6-phosphate isomerase